MHCKRVAYYVTGEGILPESPDGGEGAESKRVPALRFGRLFGRTQCAPRPEETDRVVRKLMQLGHLMNERAGGGNAGGNNNDSDIPAGYTYLGQFIAHEITFDSTGDLLRANLQPENLRTPEVDLDSLYGSENGPKDHPELYSDGVRLKTDKTVGGELILESFPNDLPRGTKDSPDGKKKGSPKEALLGDPRNDENLALAQTHLAFIHFHNKVVDKIWAEHADYSAAKVFEQAREQVIRHYQWIIVYDFLPQLVRADVLECVMNHGNRWFKGNSSDGLFMPIEFSAAAFRIGHSMVRDIYEWNPLRRTDKYRYLAVSLTDLFMQTGFLRDIPPAAAAGAPAPQRRPLDGYDNLKSNWVIDWRHFYNFDELGHVCRVPKRNFSAKLDTVFDFRLDEMGGFPAESIAEMQRAITVRNLLRGFYLGLPTGEEAAEWMGETPLTRKELSSVRLANGEMVSGPHEAVLDDPVFWGKTPLWYYVLKEAELVGCGPDGKPGNRLGPVGGRIVAETLIGLVRNSPYSIFEENPEGEKWCPTLGRAAGDGKPARFGMIDLLDFAGVVDPIAAFIRQNLPDIPLEE